MAATRGGLLRDLIHEGSLVFDVGANIGKMTELYLELGAIVVAVEPQTVCVQEHLRPRFGGNERVTIVQAAAGAEPGRGTITIYGHGSTISTMVPEHYWQAGGPWANTPHDGSEPVEMVTLDMLIERHGLPDFIKIDVEGYERQVLEGLSQFAPLSFEFHPFFAEAAKRCMARILEIEPGAEFSFTKGEELSYAVPWTHAEALGCQVDELYRKHGRVYFGNIYARCAGGHGEMPE